MRREKPPPHANKTRKTAQTQKQPRSKAEAWDEEKLGELILTKQESDIRRKNLVTTLPPPSCSNQKL
jgi:hypothetical protein